MSTRGRKEHCGKNFHDPLLQPKPDGVDLRSLWTLLYPSTSGDWYGCSADLWKHPHRPAEQYMLLLKLLPQPHGSTAYLWLMTVRRTRSKFREAAASLSNQNRNGVFSCILTKNIISQGNAERKKKRAISQYSFQRTKNLSQQSTNYLHVSFVPSPAAPSLQGLT